MQVSHRGERESSHNLAYLDPKYCVNYTDGVHLVHCTKGTCNLNEVVGAKVIHKMTYQM